MSGERERVSSKSAKYNILPASSVQMFLCFQDQSAFDKFLKLSKQYSKEVFWQKMTLQLYQRQQFNFIIETSS